MQKCIYSEVSSQGLSIIMDISISYQEPLQKMVM